MTINNIPNTQLAITNNNPAMLIVELRNLAHILESKECKMVSGGIILDMSYPTDIQTGYIQIKSDLVLQFQ